MIEPVWPDIQLVRPFLRGLVGLSVDSAELECLQKTDPNIVAEWLYKMDFAPLAYHRYRESWPTLTNLLSIDYYTTMGLNIVHQERLQKILAKFNSADLPIVLLKGAALSHTVYDTPLLRPMRDIDFWLADADIPRAIQILSDLGYLIAKADRRPLNQQRELVGEMMLGQVGNPPPTHLDLHWQPIHGWWARYCANIDLNQLWATKERFNIGEQYAYRLSAEDMILHLTSHAAINYLGPHVTLRAVIDTMLISQKSSINWQLLAQRAISWRIQYPLWFILQLVVAFFDHPHARAILPLIQPSPLRQRYFAQMVSINDLLVGRNLENTKWRFAVVLAFAEHPSDIGRFFGRMIWPEKSWLAARYPSSPSYKHHLSQLARKKLHAFDLPKNQ